MFENLHFEHVDIGNEVVTEVNPSDFEKYEADILVGEGNIYHLKKNDVFLINCRKLHHYYANDQLWHHSTLHFYGGCAEAIYTEFQKEHATVFHCTDSPQYQAILEKLLHEYEPPSIHRDFTSSVMLIQLFNFLLDNVRLQSETILPEHHQMHIEENNMYNANCSKSAAIFAGSTHSSYRAHPMGCRKHPYFSAFSSTLAASFLRCRRSCSSPF